MTVYGDPHILTYKANFPVTCSVQGVSVYLSNEYFSLQGDATQPGDWTTATSVTSVSLY